MAQRPVVSNRHGAGPADPASFSHTRLGDTGVEDEREDAFILSGLPFHHSIDLDPAGRCERRGLESSYYAKVALRFFS